MKFVGLVALLAGGTAASNISGLGPAVQFIIKNDYFCPRTGNHQDFTWRLVDLYKVPSKLMTWLTEAAESGHQLPGLSAIAKGVSQNFAVMDECLHKTDSLKDFHLCYLEAVGFNPLYTSLFSCLPNYPEWIHLLPVNLNDPNPSQDEIAIDEDMFSRVMLGLSPPSWNLSSFLKDVGSSRLREALLACSADLFYQTAKESLNRMTPNNYKDIQLDTIKVLMEFEGLSYLAPVSHANPPLNPTDLALVILKHHVKYTKHQEILENLRNSLKGAPFITITHLKSIFQQVSDNNTSREMNAPRKDNFLKILSTSPESDYSAFPPLAIRWFDALLEAIWDSNFARRPLLVSLLDVEFGLPHDLHDKVIEPIIQCADLPMDLLAQIAAKVKLEDQLNVMNGLEISHSTIPEDALQAMLWKQWKTSTKQHWQWLSLNPGLFAYQPIPPKYLPDLVVADTLRHTTVPLIDKMLICLHPSKSELQENLLRGLLLCDPAVNDYSNL